MKKQRVKNKVPRLTTDKQAEAFLSNDLSHLDFSQNQQINMRVPEPLLAAVKARAKARGIPYTRFIRETLEQALSVSK